jgi:hypothetical protein
LEAADFLRRSLKDPKVPSALSAERDIVADVVVVMAIEEAEDGLLQTLTELTSMPSIELLLLKSGSNTKRMDFTSSATRRDTVSSNARS